MQIIKRLFPAILLAFAALGPASADVFRVRGIAVDATGANYTQARDNAVATAKTEAAALLIERLTLPEDRANASSPIDPADVARFANTFDSEVSDKFTATRYISVLAINFDANTVRSYLEARGVPYVDGQAGLALLVPMGGQNVDALMWGQTWTGKDDNTVLTPYVVSQESWDRPPTWEDVAVEAQARGATRAMVASAYVSGGQVYVRLIELRPGAAESAVAVAGPFPSLEAAQAGAIASAEREWKRASIVRTTGSTVMEVVARFSDLGQWVKIRKGFEASRIIRDFEVQSMSTKGADLSFIFAGRPDQLAADLRSRGLQLGGTDDGYIVQTAAGQ